jgi:hypothetical protein
LPFLSCCCTSKRNIETILLRYFGPCPSHCQVIT